MEITKEMRIVDVLSICPETAEVFMGFGMQCFACPMGENETIEEACLVHNIDVDELLQLLNEKITKN